VVKAARQTLEDIETRKLVTPRGAGAADRDDSDVAEEGDEW
jgi:hypothetical protein